MNKVESLQDRYAPHSVCFGCGPANEQGLQIKSRVSGDNFTCDWSPKPYHHAFAGVLNGGITGTILDCHSNWAAAYSLMIMDAEVASRSEEGQDAAAGPPSTVTAEFTLKLMRPTPMNATLHLVARVVDLNERKATVESTLGVGGVTTAVFRGVFVAVGQGHPAYSRWR